MIKKFEAYSQEDNKDFIRQRDESEKKQEVLNFRVNSGLDEVKDAISNIIGDHVRYLGDFTFDEFFETRAEIEENDIRTKIEDAGLDYIEDYIDWERILDSYDDKFSGKLLYISEWLFEVPEGLGYTSETMLQELEHSDELFTQYRNETF